MSHPLIDALKDRPCYDCGQSFPSAAMQFDHVRGVKNANLADMAGYSRARILREAAKCEVVCGNCHAIREQERRLDRHVDAALDYDVEAELG